MGKPPPTPLHVFRCEAGSRKWRRPRVAMEADAWLLESILAYKELHMFDLQEPTRTIEWVDDNSVCVAGFNSEKKNEILELGLPQKLLPKEKQGMCPERDFKVVHGGFSNRPVYRLESIRGTSLLLSSGPTDNSIQLWQRGGDDTDVVRNVGEIHNSRREPQWSHMCCSSDQLLLHGSSIGTVQTTDLHTRQATFCLGDSVIDGGAGGGRLCALAFVDGGRTLLACGNVGDLWLLDARSGRVAAHAAPSPPPEAGSQADDGPRCACAAALDGGRSGGQAGRPGVRVARFWASGRVAVSDARNLDRVVAAATLESSCRKSATAPEETEESMLCVSWSPTAPENIALSGFDGMVHIYDTTSWTPDLAPARPSFVHKGHTVVEGDARDAQVTQHAWHPWRARTLLSAGNDGSLHAWEWVLP
ncbi:unnamed protein product [Lampetra planeri]